MHCVERVRRAMARTALSSVLLLAAALTACADGLGPNLSTPAPESLVVTALRPGTIRLTWAQLKGIAVAQYIVERRVNFVGDFVEVARLTDPNLGALSWLDTDVVPETVYGYRVIALTPLGDKSRPSVTGGTLTPPRPGIQISTSSSATVAEALDPDGYTLTLTGPDTVRANIGVDAMRRFSPLKTGRYTVSMSGVIDRCSVSGGASREVVVIDTSASTITPVSFNVICRDPNRGEIVVVLAVSGADLDNAFMLDVLGQAADSTLPQSQRVYSAQRTITGGADRNEFPNIRPGEYTVTLKDVAANCALQGGAPRTVTVSRLAVATINYAIVCSGPTVPGGTTPTVSTAPFVWRNRWMPRTAASGATVVLEPTLDLTARQGRVVQGVQASLFYDATVLRYVSRAPGQLEDLIVNTSTPGRINLIASSSTPLPGVVSLARFTFAVIGAVGTLSPTTTRDIRAGSPMPFSDSVRVVEDTLTVGVAAAPGANQPPTARAGGPYTGTAGVALALSAATSTDADGTIASYAWTFGDNTTGTGVTPSKTYASAGTYTATLTVTDDRGAAATSQVTVTIATAATPTPTPSPTPSAPVARVNGPYTATTGVAVTLSSAGTTNATGFSWLLGNGQTVTGASPVVTYAAAGTYAITLTVTGATGLTATSTTSINVTAAPVQPPANTTPFTWTNRATYNANSGELELTVLFDITTNIPETPGAEALERFSVDSLKWDSGVMQFVSVNLGPNIVGTSNQAGVPAGRIGFSGTIGAGTGQGLITVATLRFRPVGTRGASTTTRTFLGALNGPSSTNFFTYNGKTTITEGQFTVP